MPLDRCRIAGKAVQAKQTLGSIPRACCKRFWILRRVERDSAE